MLTVIISAIAIIALATTNIYTLYTNHRESKAWQEERKDIYDRLMSKDLTEYKEQTAAPITYAAVSKDDDDLYRQEIEDNKV